MKKGIKKMNDKMNNDVILIRNVIESTINELNNKKMIKKISMTAYQKTEQVLYSYNDYKQAVNDKLEKIEEIKQYGLSKKSGSIIPMPSGTSKNVSDEEKEQEAIETLQKSITLTQRYISIINAALDKIKNESYSDIIKMIYFEKKSLEEVSTYYKVDISTISRNRRNVVKKLSIYLFSDEVINELYS